MLKLILVAVIIMVLALNFANAYIFYSPTGWSADCGCIMLPKIKTIK